MLAWLVTEGSLDFPGIGGAGGRWGGPGDRAGEREGIGGVGGFGFGGRSGDGVGRFGFAAISSGVGGGGLLFAGVYGPKVRTSGLSSNETLVVDLGARLVGGFGGGAFITNPSSFRGCVGRVGRVIAMACNAVGIGGDAPRAAPLGLYAAGKGYGGVRGTYDCTELPPAWGNSTLV